MNNFHFLSASLFAVSLLASPVQAAGPCGLKKVEIKPSRPDDFGEYTGQGQAVQLTFKNDDPKKPTRFFPDNPLVVKNLKTKSSCRIDGGIWSAERVFLGAGEKILAVSEESGSSAEMDFYDTESCKKRGTIDITSAKNTFDPDRIVTEGSCETFEKGGKKLGSCNPAAIYALGEECRPRLLEKESADLTKKIFGVEFKKPETIEAPYSDHAKVVNP